MPRFSSTTKSTRHLSLSHSRPHSPHLLKLAARGVVSLVASSDTFNGENLTKTRTVITVQEIVIPGAIISQNKEKNSGRKLALQDFGKAPFDILAHRSHVRIKPIGPANELPQHDSPLPDAPEPDTHAPAEPQPPLDEHGVEMISVAEGLDAVDEDEDVRVGHFNSTGHRYIGHDSIWLLNEIQELEITLGERYHCNPVQLLWVNGNLYTKSEQTAGIIQIPKSTCELVEMQPFNEETDANQKQAYLAKMQGTRKPVLPVHTIAEKQLFSELMRTSPTFQKCSTSISLAAAEIWNARAENTAEIYYKLKEQLTAYLNGPYKDSANIRQSCAQARGQTDSLHVDLQDPQRAKKIVNTSSGPLVPNRVTTGFVQSIGSAVGSSAFCCIDLKNPKKPYDKSRPPPVDHRYTGTGRPKVYSWDLMVS
ncbi:hypothetical protein C8R46DRAFT_1208069 [Mycena filopes]|nr:hypothetical protein C8R46DRAFT_1208069 [Mycena filopes]